MKKVKYKEIADYNILGIDLGNKGSGNTAFCFLSKSTLQFKQTKKGEDELSVIFHILKKHPIKLVSIDAPLSFPGVYFHKHKFTDYQYRECDKLCKAMSPMFIGAFTARAIQLKNILEENKIEVIEVYPKKLAEILDLKKDYPLKREQDVPMELVKKIKKIAPYPVKKTTSMHQFDSLLCWLSAHRYIHSHHEEFGNKNEGIIIV